MRAFIAGVFGAVTVRKGEDTVLPVVVHNDDGSLLDLTGGSIDLVVYDRSDRANATPIATHAGDALTAATAGHATMTIGDAELNYATGDYYVFVRFTNATSKIYFADPIVWQVR